MEHRGQMSERDERADGVLGPLHERLVTPDVGEVDAESRVPLPRKRGGEGLRAFLGQVDRSHARPTVRECTRDRGADAPHGTGDDDTLPCEALPERRRRAHGRGGIRCASM